MYNSAPVVFNYEMGYTETEFAKVLSGDFTGQKSGLHCQGDGLNRWLISQQSAPLQVNIGIKQGKARQLGAMALPVLDVNFAFTSATAQQIDSFLERFFKYFHKGGG